MYVEQIFVLFVYYNKNTLLEYFIHKYYTYIKYFSIDFLRAWKCRIRCDSPMIAY